MFVTDIAHQDHVHTQNRFAVIPTPEKLQADLRYSGRGVCIAFLDSGFYPHPDFAERVIAFHDVAGEESSFAGIVDPAGHHWHGTQTVISCAGDGRLSDGTYRGLASEAELVLVKASTAGRIGDASIEKGLEWLLANRERYNIRILNMSLGGDRDLPTRESRINQLAEELVASGVVVTVAAGNSDMSRSIPPASAPSVITVGGFSDENQYETSKFDLYHSSFGATADDLVKPELIAPAMYVAAPILPNTADYRAAERLSQLEATPDYAFRLVLESVWKDAGLEPAVLSLGTIEAREMVAAELRRRKVVAHHYQHVDGTSFAAPITASVVAQMLEANPRLTPAIIKNILVSTAARLGGHPAIRQGFGVLNARFAVERAEAETHTTIDHRVLTPPRIEGRNIVFSFHDDDARSVNLVGDINDWSRDATPLERTEDGLWRVAVPCRPAGSYRYKFLIDGGARWTEDPSHGLKKEDGFGGFNSILLVA